MTRNRFYIEAYRADGSQILGNLDGQTVFHCSIPNRTKHYKRLKLGIDRPLHERVHHWILRDAGDRELETILNKWRNEI